MLTRTEISEIQALLDSKAFVNELDLIEFCTRFGRSEEFIFLIRQRFAQNRLQRINAALFEFRYCSEQELTSLSEILRDDPVLFASVKAIYSLVGQE
jgi:hypothetical protein